jgi:glycosyltransferase involved in cell wall biosynthesis
VPLCGYSRGKGQPPPDRQRDHPSGALHEARPPWYGLYHITMFTRISRTGRSRQKSILLVAERFWPEQLIVNELASAFVDRGYALTVLTQAPSYPRAVLFPGYRNRFVSFEHHEGMRIIRVATVLHYRGNLVRKALHYVSFAVLSTLVWCVYLRAFDTVFVCQAGALTQAALALVPCVFRKPRRVIWTQDVWPDSLFPFGFSDRGLVGWGLGSFIRAVYRRFDSVLVSSPGFLDTLKGYLPRGMETFFVPQWVPQDLARGRTVPTDLDRASLKFVFAGNIGSMLNLEKVIRGFHVAGERSTRPLSLTLIGDGSAVSKLKLLVRKDGVKGVRFTGRKDLSEMKSWLEAADVLVLPLVSASGIGVTLPAKFTAYLSARKPILAIASGELASMVRRHELGCVANPDDLESIAAGFLSAASWTHQQVLRMAENASRVLEGFFTASASLKRVFTAMNDAR